MKPFTPVNPHRDAQRLGLLMRGSLEEWQRWQPEYCQRIEGTPNAYRVTTGALTFDVALDDDWEPSESELNVIDLAVTKAAQARHWRSSVTLETADSECDQIANFVGRTVLGGGYVVESECCDRAIARLQSYLLANRGDY